MDQGISQGISEGISQGINEGARQVVLRLLADKFGQVPPAVDERVQQSDAEWCQRMTLAISRARTLEELNLS